MRLALACVLVLLSACTQPKPVNYAQEVRDAEAAMLKAAAAKDLDSFVAFYTDDASVLSPNEPILSGKAAIKEAMKPMLADPQFSLTLVAARVEVAKSGDLAFTQGPYKMSFSDVRGNRFEDEGKYLKVWRKQADGSWKAVEDTMNSDLPLPPPPNP